MCRSSPLGATGTLCAVEIEHEEDTDSCSEAGGGIPKVAPAKKREKNKEKKENLLQREIIQEGPH